MRSIILAAWFALAMGLGSLAHAADGPPPLEAYGQLPTIDMVSLSPSGQRMAFVVRDEHGAKIYAREVDGPILMAAPVNDGFIDGVSWAGEDIVLVRVSNIMKEGEFLWTADGAFALDIATKKAVQIFKNVANLQPQIEGFDGVRNLGSRWYGYFATTSCAESSACGLTLFKVDLETGAPIQLDRTKTSAQWLLDDDGEIIARMLYEERTSRWSLDSLKLGKTIAQGDAGFDGVSVWGLGRSPDTALLHTRAADGFYTVFEAQLGDGTPPKALTQGQEVSFEWRSPDTNRLVGYAWYDDAYHDVLFDPLAQKRVDAANAAFPKNRVSLTSASRDFGRIVSYTDGGDDSGTYWLVDIEAGKATVLGSAYPQVTAAQTGPVSVFRYKATDGLPLEAVLTTPPGLDPKGLPLVVLVHGGPEERARPGFSWLAQAFASRGYAVLEPNFRGSSGFGKAFRDAGFDQWGRKMQTDVSDGVDALAATGVVDPKRACIVGLDYGGYAALAGVTLQQGRYRCAVGFEGAYDLPNLLTEKSSPYLPLSRKYWSAFIGDRDAGANLDQISPIKRAAEADAPVLLVHAKPNWTFVIDQTPQMEQALRQAGKPVDLTLIDSDDWSLRTADARIALLKAAVPFVEKNDPSGAR